jgi:hypothetical protein
VSKISKPEKERNWENGGISLRAILNKSKLVTKPIRFIEQTHLLGQFKRGGIGQAVKVNIEGRLKV